MQVPSATTPSEVSPLTERVQEVVDGWRAEHGVPGVAVSIREAGRPLVDA